MPGTATLRLDFGSHDSQDNDKRLEDFKKARGVQFVLAFSGGADDGSPMVTSMLEGIREQCLATTTPSEFDALVKRFKKKYIADIVRDVLGPLRGYKIAILTGGTSWGVPAVAAEVAKEFGFPTIGVFPLIATTKTSNMLPEGMLDLSICVHPTVGESMWGDEGVVYTKLLSAVIIIGGRAGTMVEVTHLLKQNENKRFAMKPIIPITGTGGTADMLAYFPGNQNVMAKSLPRHIITDGKGAFAHLIDQGIITDDLFD